MLIGSDLVLISIEFSHELAICLALQLIKKLSTHQVSGCTCNWFSHVAYQRQPRVNGFRRNLMSHPNLVNCAKLNFLASPRFGTVREFLRMLFSSPTLMAISLRILLRPRCTSLFALSPTSLLLTRVIVNRSMVFQWLVSFESFLFLSRTEN